jgi:hypothetical protein
LDDHSHLSADADFFAAVTSVMTTSFMIIFTNGQLRMRAYAGFAGFFLGHSLRFYGGFALAAVIVKIPDTVLLGPRCRA